MLLFEWYEDAANAGEQRLIQELEQTRVQRELLQEAEERQMLAALEAMRCEDDLERFDFEIIIQEAEAEAVAERGPGGTYILNNDASGSRDSAGNQDGALDNDGHIDATTGSDSRLLNVKGNDHTQNGFSMTFSNGTDPNDQTAKYTADNTNLYDESKNPIDISNNEGTKDGSKQKSMDGMFTLNPSLNKGN